VLELWGWETVINSIGTDIKFPLEKGCKDQSYSELKC